MTDRIDLGGESWQAIPRRVLRDERLSLAATGALVTLLSHDEGWVRSCIAVLMHEHRCGRAAARSAMKELVANGYAKLGQVRRPNGTFGTAYTVYAIPQETEPEVAVSPGAVPPGAVHSPAVVEPKGVEPQSLTTLSADAPGGVHKHGKPRKRDPAFDALASLHGGANLTPVMGRRVGVALAEIRSVDPDVTADEINRRAKAYRRLTWNQRGSPPSAQALAKWWADCGTGGTTAPDPYPTPSRNLRNMTDDEVLETYERARHG